MESSQRGALGLVRFVAFCLIVAGILDAVMCLTQYETPYYEVRHHLPVQQPPAPLHLLRLVLDALPVIAGLVLFIKGKAIAEWLADLIE